MHLRKKDIIPRLTGNRVLRFLVSGGLATVTYYIVAMVGHYAQDMPIMLINSIAYAAGFLVSYSLQRNWTFKSKTTHKKTLPLYFLVSGTGFAINSAIVFLGEFFGIMYSVSAVAATIITAVASYVMQKNLVFHQEGTHD